MLKKTALFSGDGFPYRAASFFTASNDVGNPELRSSKKLVGREEVAVEDSEAEDILLQVLHKELHACVPVRVAPW